MEFTMNSDAKHLFVNLFSKMFNFFFNDNYHLNSLDNSIKRFPHLVPLNNVTKEFSLDIALFRFYQDQ